MKISKIYVTISYYYFPILLTELLWVELYLFLRIIFTFIIHKSNHLPSKGILNPTYFATFAQSTL